MIAITGPVACRAGIGHPLMVIAAHWLGLSQPTGDPRNETSN
jgi:hypothetical protein